MIEYRHTINLIHPIKSKNGLVVHSIELPNIPVFGNGVIGIEKPRALGFDNIMIPLSNISSITEMQELVNYDV